MKRWYVIRVIHYFYAFDRHDFYWEVYEAGGGMWWEHEIRNEDEALAWILQRTEENDQDFSKTRIRREFWLQLGDCCLEREVDEDGYTYIDGYDKNFILVLNDGWAIDENVVIKDRRGKVLR